MLRFMHLIILCLTATYAAANTQYNYQLIQSGFAIPWGITFIDNQTMVVMERNGVTKTLDVNSGKTVAIKKVGDVYAYGQGGLFDVAASPANSLSLYFTYSNRLLLFS